MRLLTEVYSTALAISMLMNSIPLLLGFALFHSDAWLLYSFFATWVLLLTFMYPLSTLILIWLLLKYKLKWYEGEKKK